MVRLGQRVIRTVTTAAMSSSNKPAQVDASTLARSREPPTRDSPIVMFGPSGTGKSTLLKRLQAEPEWSRFGFSVSRPSLFPPSFDYGTDQGGQTRRGSRDLARSTACPTTSSSGPTSSPSSPTGPSSSTPSSAETSTAPLPLPSRPSLTRRPRNGASSTLTPKASSSSSATTPTSDRSSCSCARRA